MLDNICVIQPETYHVSVHVFLIVINMLYWGIPLLNYQTHAVFVLIFNNLLCVCFVGVQQMIVIICHTCQLKYMFAHLP